MPITLPQPAASATTPDLSLPLTGALAVPCAAGAFQLKRVSLTDGPSQGVELLLVESDRVRAAICPTRGLSLWKAHIDGLDCSWKSPVEGPIHPRHVPLSEANGLGWLDGFDELLVRCGLQSFGAPDFGDQGQLRFPLHGRIGNLPARALSVSVDAEHSLLEVQAEIHETRFLQFDLRLSVKYVFAMGQPQIQIHDRVRNAAGTPTTMQMLYHINVGHPILGAGARLHIAADKVVARNEHAARDLASWRSYPGPVAGYEEQVYFSSARADLKGWTSALLASANGKSGFAVHYKTDTLPYFTQWKNTVAESDGYVTGLEPGTGFPNPRSFEEQQGRLVSLAAGQTVDFELRIEGINDAGTLASLEEQIDASAKRPMDELTFDTDWCTPR